MFHRHGNSMSFVTFYFSLHFWKIIIEIGTKFHVIYGFGHCFHSHAPWKTCSILSRLDTFPTINDMQTKMTNITHAHQAYCTFLLIWRRTQLRPHGMRRNNQTTECLCRERERESVHMHVRVTLKSETRFMPKSILWLVYFLKHE